MDVLWEDKYFKNFDERTLDVSAIKNMKSVNIFLMIFLSVITFGIYPVYWFYNKSKEVNGLYPIRKISNKFLNFFLFFFIIDPGINIIDYLQRALINETVIKLSSNIIGFMLLFWVFFIRNRMNAIIGAKPSDQQWFKGVLTFFFNLFYIQHKINKLNENKFKS